MSIKSIDNQLPGVPLQPNMLEDLGWAPAIQKPAESDGQTSQPKSEMCRKTEKKKQKNGKIHGKLTCWPWESPIFNGLTHLPSPIFPARV